MDETEMRREERFFFWSKEERVERLDFFFENVCASLARGGQLR